MAKNMLYKLLDHFNPKVHTNHHIQSLNIWHFSNFFIGHCHAKSDSITLGNGNFGIFDKYFTWKTICHKIRYLTLIVEALQNGNDLYQLQWSRPYLGNWVQGAHWHPRPYQVERGPHQQSPRKPPPSAGSTPFWPGAPHWPCGQAAGRRPCDGLF